MKKLVYLTYADLSQVDMGFLHHLSGTYEIYYLVIIPEKNSNFSEYELSEYCSRYHIQFKAYHLTHRRRDIRVGLDFWKIIKDIKKLNPDIIYTISHDLPVFSLLCLFLNRKITIVAIHDVKFHSQIPFEAMFKIGRSIIMRHFNFFQVLSKNQEAVFREWYPQKKVFTIPLTVSDFGSPDNDNKLLINNSPETIRFLFFGNIVPYKGLKYLIRAINKLSKSYSNFELLIAGRCDVWDEVYEPLIENKNTVSRKIGFISNEDIPVLFANSHYLILPYTDATQSGPLMIAYNYHIPVIASNIPAFTEMVEEGTSGFLFNLNDPESLELTLEDAILRTAGEYSLLLEKLKSYVQDNYATAGIVEKYNKMFSGLIN